MLALMQSHFEGITRARFERDLGEKGWVVLVEDVAGRICGFSSLLVYRTAHQGAPIRVVYSGDTIVERGAWGSSVLPRTWIESVSRVAGSAGIGRTYWLLICSGYRTYRFLPVFWRAFWPRHDAATPPAAQALMDHLAAERFGECYERERGVVRFAAAPTLHDDLREVPTARLRDPHVAFFTARNPGSVRGDELVCLCELSPANLTRAGRRMLEPARWSARAPRGVVA
jgi:hypothetical protein